MRKGVNINTKSRGIKPELVKIRNKLT